MKLKIGIAGLGRGRTWVNNFSTHKQSEVVAVCDMDTDRLAQYPTEVSKYGDYEKFLKHELDVVVICTPLPEHIKHTIAALEGGKHVLCEVPAVNTLEECKQVVQTVEKTGLKYMLAENSCYSDMNLAWKEKIDGDELGKILYAEAEYVHDCRGIMRHPDGSLTWRASMPPIHYCTHSLGPLLFLLEDRCVSVTGLSTGSNIAPELGAIDLEVGLFKTERGTIIKILCGFSIERHPSFHWYVVYGTKGALESQRRYKGSGRGYLQEIAPEREMIPHEIDTNAHGTAEGRIADGFIQSIINDTKPPIDVYEAMDYTAPGICAHLSSELDSDTVQIPNFRDSSSIGIR